MRWVWWLAACREWGRGWGQSYSQKMLPRATEGCHLPRWESLEDERVGHTAPHPEGRGAPVKVSQPLPSIWLTHSTFESQPRCYLLLAFPKPLDFSKSASSRGLCSPLSDHSVHYSDFTCWCESLLQHPWRALRTGTLYHSLSWPHHLARCRARNRHSVLSHKVCPLEF